MTHFNLATDRLTISKLSYNDAAFILELVNSPGWLKFIGDRNITTEENAKEYLKNGPLKTYSEFGFGLFRISLGSSGLPIGICGLLKRDYLDFPDLGFALLPKFEGSGYAQESCRAILKYTREYLNVPALYAIVTPENQKSRHLLSKLDFEMIETITENDTHLDLFKLTF